MKSIIPTKRRWVSKHASGNCGVGTTLYEWKVQADPLCPRECGLPEDSNHIFTCNHKSNIIEKEAAKKEFAEYLIKLKTDPVIGQALNFRIKNFLYNNNG